jgi:hypothetical protein
MHRVPCAVRSHCDMGTGIFEVASVRPVGSNPSLSRMPANSKITRC